MPDYSIKAINSPITKSPSKSEILLQSMYGQVNTMLEKNCFDKTSIDLILKTLNFSKIPIIINTVTPGPFGGH